MLQFLQLVSSLPEGRVLAGDEATALLHLLRDYSFALEVLEHYHKNRLPPFRGAEETAQAISLEEALCLVDTLRAQSGGSSLFGQLQGNG